MATSFSRGRKCVHAAYPLGQSALGSEYDSCTINAFVLGVNKYNFDAWKGGGLYVERLVMFNNKQPSAVVKASVKHLDQF